MLPAPQETRSPQSTPEEMWVYYTSITIGTDGLPVISYFDDTNDDLKVAKCGNAACSSGNTLTTVDSGGTVGYSYLDHHRHGRSACDLLS